MGYWLTEADIVILRQRCDVGTGCSIAKGGVLDGNRPSGRVSIGNNTTISGKVIVLCHDAAGMRLGCPMIYGHTKIGNDCFIGVGSTILVGVKIGNRCIVGAGSMVTKDIPDGEVWGGNPAKFIKDLQ